MSSKYYHLQRSIYFSDIELLNKIDEWAKEMEMNRSELICKAMKVLIEVREKSKEGKNAQRHIQV